jgi:ABC-type uncharacterized transport system ATPase subunit
MSESPESTLRSLPGVSHVERDRNGFTLGISDGTPPSRLMAEVAALMPVRRIELKRVDLEDVFIDLVQAAGEHDIKREDLRAADQPEPEAARA